MKKTKRIYLALLAVVLTPMAQADLIDQGDTTLDTNTGLEWLDLTLTQGENYNSIVGGFGGYVAAGYRYATAGEVCALMSAFGDDLACLNAGAEPIQQSSADDLVALLGNTQAANQPPRSGSLGILDGGFLASGFVGMGCIDAGPVNGCADPPPNIFLSRKWDDFDRSSLYIGSFLVRSAQVPEPGTLALLGLGLAGIGVSRRRKR